MQNNNKKGGLSRLGDFLAGKGFYIVLFLCVAAIGVSGYFLLADSMGPTQSVANPTQVVVTPPPALPPVTQEPAPTPTPVPVTPAPTQTATPTPVPTPTPTPGPPAAQGTVIDVSFDELMGATVTVEHQDGLESKYCNLAAKPTVAVGDEVETGSVIGSVGATAAAEGARASHLHFELSKDGAAVDPLDYLPELL